MPPLYLLDTNILVHLIRGDAVGEHLRSNYQLLMQQPVPILSFVTLAEMRSLALQWGWGRPRLEQLAFYASHFGTAPLETPEMLDAFALLDAWSERQGRVLGKNDLWIAATASTVARSQAMSAPDRALGSSTRISTVRGKTGSPFDGLRELRRPRVVARHGPGFGETVTTRRV